MSDDLLHEHDEGDVLLLILGGDPPVDRQPTLSELSPPSSRSQVSCVSDYGRDCARGGGARRWRTCPKD